MEKLKSKLRKWLYKDVPLIQSEIKPIIIQPQGLKRFHAQKVITKHEWYAAKVDPDYYVRTFRFDIANELLNEILIKIDETEDGIRYSADLLYENI